MSFERPVGAAADAKELEYIAALIQTTDTDKDGFMDASIEARDIKYHLMSRYGIHIRSAQVRNIILPGLGGGDGEGDCLDICEVVAALIIPTLRKIVLNSDTFDNDTDDSGNIFKEHSRKSYLEAFRENAQVNLRDDAEEESSEHHFYKDVPPEEILWSVLQNILLQATGSSEPAPLTKELVRKIFAVYDETALVSRDDLVSEMIAAARGGKNFSEDDDDEPVLFDVDTFATALTSDVMLYDPEVENRVTTNFVDAFGSGVQLGRRSDNVVKENSESVDMNDNGGQKPFAAKGTAQRVVSFVLNDTLDGVGETVIVDSDSGGITKNFTFSAIDFTVDNYRSRFQVLLVWLGFVAFYARYLSNNANPRNLNICDGNGFGCKIGQSIFDWTVLMLLLSIIGVIYFAVVSSGNDVYRKSFLDVIVGMGGLVVFILMPYIIKFDAGWFKTDVDQQDELTETIYLVVFILVGSLLFICQCLNALRLLFPDEVIGHSKILSSLLAGSNAQDEHQFKRAAVYKVNKMLENAYKLHQHETSLSLCKENESTHDLALLNFTKISDETEVVGSFLWAWKSFFNGDLKKKEGIWLHTRIYAGMFAQLLLVVLILILGTYLFIDLIDIVKENEVPVCSASFNPENCYAPEYNGFKVGIMGCVGVTLEGPGCNAFQAEGQLLETTCDYIPAIPTTNKTVCDYVYSFDRKYAMAIGDDISEGDCSALMSTCVVYDEIDSNTQTATCLLGMSPGLFLPYKFEGPECENIPVISEILASKPKLFDRVESVIGNADSLKGVTDSLMPQRWMLVLCAIVGLVVGCIVGLSIFVYYIPSTISTVLKFRSGAIPSLRDPNFIKYRKSLEGVTYILGLMVWGAVSSVIVSVAFFSGIVFFAVWHVTRPVVINIIAIIIGISATLIFKTLLVMVLGRINYAAFYRKRPWIGNVCSVALECWHLGITTGYVLARTVKLLIAASMYIGRIDKPFMGDDVGIIGPIHLDQFPFIYRKDLLSADAHRHPYVERLGLLYLMKLRYGSKFATTAGSMWRLLFVFALMPWLRKYRITDDVDLPEELLMQKLGLGPHTQYEETIRELQHEIRSLRKSQIVQLQDESGKVRFQNLSINSSSGEQQENVRFQENSRKVRFQEKSRRVRFQEEEEPIQSSQHHFEQSSQQKSFDPFEEQPAPSFSFDPFEGQSANPIQQENSPLDENPLELSEEESGKMP